MGETLPDPGLFGALGSALGAQEGQANILRGLSSFQARSAAGMERLKSLKRQEKRIEQARLDRFVQQERQAVLARQSRKQQFAQRLQELAFREQLRKDMLQAQKEAELEARKQDDIRRLNLEKKRTDAEIEAIKASDYDDETKRALIISKKAHLSRGVALKILPSAEDRAEIKRLEREKRAVASDKSIPPQDKAIALQEMERKKKEIEENPNGAKQYIPDSVLARGAGTGTELRLPGGDSVVYAVDPETGTIGKPIHDDRPTARDLSALDKIAVGFVEREGISYEEAFARAKRLFRPGLSARQTAQTGDASGQAGPGPEVQDTGQPARPDAPEGALLEGDGGASAEVATQPADGETPSQQATPKTPEGKPKPKPKPLPYDPRKLLPVHISKAEVAENARKLVEQQGLSEENALAFAKQAAKEKSVSEPVAAANLVEFALVDPFATELRPPVFASLPDKQKAVIRTRIKIIRKLRREGFPLALAFARDPDFTRQQFKALEKIRNAETRPGTSPRMMARFTQQRAAILKKLREQEPGLFELIRELKKRGR